ncbi:unnamed protein product, partial [Didymodactylos carnosus]
IDSEDYNIARSLGGPAHGYSNFVNPFLEIPDPSKTVEYMQGYVNRKCCIEPDGKRTPFMRRSWKTFYASLRDMVLYLHKNESQTDTKIILCDNSISNAIRVHHALATEAKEYTKKQHVFRLRTADWAEYLFQTSDHELLKKWVDAINFVAATFSSPPLPPAIDSTFKFQRPLLPSVQTRFSIFEQFDFISHQITETKKQLQELKSPDKQVIVQTSKQREILDNKEKIDYLEYELTRYETYSDRLRRHFQELNLDHRIGSPNFIRSTLITSTFNNTNNNNNNNNNYHHQINNNNNTNSSNSTSVSSTSDNDDGINQIVSYNKSENFIGPIEQISGVHQTQNSAHRFQQHQILPTRNTTNRSHTQYTQYQKKSYHPQNNRYSYLMAVQNNPIMKEHML